MNTTRACERHLMSIQRSFLTSRYLTDGDRVYGLVDDAWQPVCSLGTLVSDGLLSRGVLLSDSECRRLTHAVKRCVPLWRKTLLYDTSSTSTSSSLVSIAPSMARAQRANCVLDALCATIDAALASKSYRFAVQDGDTLYTAPLVSAHDAARMFRQQRTTCSDHDDDDGDDDDDHDDADDDHNIKNDNDDDGDNYDHDNNVSSVGGDVQLNDCDWVAIPIDTFVSDMLCQLRTTTATAATTTTATAHAMIALHTAVDKLSRAERGRVRAAAALYVQRSVLPVAAGCRSADNTSG